MYNIGDATEKKITGDHINKGFSQENVWPFRQAYKIVAVTTRLPYFRDGRKVRFHCKYIHTVMTIHKSF